MKVKDLLDAINTYEYPPRMPVEMMLADLIYKKRLDVNTILISYTAAIEKEKELLNNRFAEATVNLTQILSGNFRKESDKEEVYKRAIHTFNLNKTLVPHIHDKQYGYTSEDDKKWDDFCEMIYGTNLKE